MLERQVHSSGLVTYRSGALDALGVPHLFTTRVGPRGDTLDLASPTDSILALLREAAGARADASVVALRQVHGGLVREIAAELPPAGAEGDGMVSGRPDRLLLAYAADCVTVLIASADGRRVAAVHAGWRGLIAGVIPAALERLGAAPAAAAIGPSLSLARCEMGPEVAELFQRAGLGDAVHERAGARPHVDLRLAAWRQLTRGGCRAIDVSDRCTYTHADELPSHRREVTHGGASRAGRIGALIAARS